MLKDTDNTVYAVATIDGGKVLYCGDNLTRAAFAFEPGTCHGSGADEVSAVRAARKAAAAARAPTC